MNQTCNVSVDVYVVDRGGRGLDRVASVAITQSVEGRERGGALTAGSEHRIGGGSIKRRCSGEMNESRREQKNGSWNRPGTVATGDDDGRARWGTSWCSARDRQVVMMMVMMMMGVDVRNSKGQAVGVEFRWARERKKS